MNFLKKIFFIFIVLNLTSLNAKPVPGSFADLAEKLMPSVVNISTTQTVKTTTNNFPFQFPPGSPFGEMFKDFERPTERKASSLGSGFIIKDNGTVITNNHVIANAEDILVRVGDKEYEAKVVGADPYMDIAVLKMKTNEKFTTVKFGDSDKARVGDWAVAIGNPFGLGGTVTAGIISARNRDINLTRYDDFIQTDASINRGNSGGPLFNMSGKVIGVNTAIFSQSGGSVGIGFAISSNLANTVVNQLVEFGRTRRGWLGVYIQDVTLEIANSLDFDETRGALVSSVRPGSPAEKAKIIPGDIVLSFDGKKIGKMKELPRIVAETEVGSKVTVEVWREGALKELTVILGELEIAENNISRAVTHNKGIMNGIDSVVIATGNDFRAVEASAHSYASITGKYTSLSHAKIVDEQFTFWMELPLSIGTVGGITNIHPLVKWCLQLLGNPSAKELMGIIAASGLAQNFAAVKSLVTEGIQAGHMKMHLNNILNSLNASNLEKQKITQILNGSDISYSLVDQTLQNLRKSEG